MEKINELISKIKQAYLEQENEELKMNDGDEIVAVFNDGVVDISSEDNEINVKIVEGKPIIINSNMEIFDEEE